MMSLAIAADVLEGELNGRDAVFTGVSTDTRTLKRGDLFVAIEGPRFDGHQFLAEAISAGASGALLARPVQTTLPYVHVENPRLALGKLAAFWRRQFNLPVIGVTGSNGKTTVKEMIGSILGSRGPGCVTQGNLNNDIGVPLTLLRIRPNDRFAVIEMGMNHCGEIEYLTRLTQPAVALITNAAEAHLEGVGTVEDVARAKGEIFAGLSANGTAIINADDPFCALWTQLAGSHRIRTFGIANKADVHGKYELDTFGSLVQIKTTEGEITMRLPLLGRHNVLNALAAGATSLAAGATLADAKRGLEKLKAVAGRMELKQGISGARVIDDTYNANPASLAAGLEALREFAGERVLVLGDMGELGAAAPDIHRRVGALARTLGIQRLFGIGQLARLSVDAFGKTGRHFDSPEALIEALLDCMHGDMTVLVKGSRFMRMERVVAGLLRTQPETPLPIGS